MRRFGLVPAAGCALVLAGCGGGGSGGTTTVAAPPAAVVVAGLEPPSGCYLTVFLADNVSRAEIASVQARLIATRAVTEVSFVSKRLELERFALDNPQKARGMHVNPFGDRFEVVPSTQGGVTAVIDDFATHGGPITNVKPSQGCAGGVG